MPKTEHVDISITYKTLVPQAGKRLAGTTNFRPNPSDISGRNPDCEIFHGRDVEVTVDLGLVQVVEGPRDRHRGEEFIVNGKKYIPDEIKEDNEEERIITIPVNNILSISSNKRII